MTRHTVHDTAGHAIGWFDPGRATIIDEPREYHADADMWLGRVSQSPTSRQAVALTASGKYVHGTATTHIAGAAPTPAQWHFVRTDRVRILQWLDAAGIDDDTRQAFVGGPRGVGRPAIGTARSIIISDATWRRIGVVAKRRGMTRSDVVREAVEDI